MDQCDEKRTTSMHPWLSKPEGLNDRLPLGNFRFILRSWFCSVNSIGLSIGLSSSSSSVVCSWSIYDRSISKLSGQPGARRWYVRWRSSLGFSLIVCAVESPLIRGGRCLQVIGGIVGFVFRVIKGLFGILAVSPLCSRFLLYVM